MLVDGKLHKTTFRHHERLWRVLYYAVDALVFGNKKGVLSYYKICVSCLIVHHHKEQGHLDVGECT